MPLSPQAFRKLALDLPEASEGSHQGHADFRVRNKIFATLGPDESWAVLKLDREQQAEHLILAPAIFEALPGGWGEKGYTRVILMKASRKLVAPALALAWLNTAPKSLSRDFEVP